MLLVYLLCALPLAAAVPSDLDTRDLKAQMQGVWKVTAARAGGIDADFPYVGSTFTVEGDSIIAARQGVVEEKLTFTLDTSKKPHSIDLHEMKSSGRGATAPGIIEVTRDTMRLSFSKSRRDPKRPQTFEFVPDNNRQISLILERVKAK